MTRTLTIYKDNGLAGCVEIRGGKVWHCDSSLGEMRDWTYQRVLDYCNRKGWLVETMTDD